MKRIGWFAIVVVVLLACVSAGFAQDPVSTAEAAATAASAEAGPDIAGLVWKFLNTPIGLSVVGSILLFILGKIFTAKPTWKKYVDKYGPLIMAAVKKAEKAIPDDVENKAVKRLDEALKYVLAVVGSAKERSMKLAITHVHAEAESNDNL